MNSEGQQATRKNLLLDYPEMFHLAVKEIVADPAPVRVPGQFTPGFALPEQDDNYRKFASVATASWHRLGEYRGRRISLLDLMENPGTHTTKTFPSLLIAARAVEYIRRSGERIVIMTPSSANKGTALRDAVLRAINAGLVEPEQLRVVTLSPQSSRYKLRKSELTRDSALRELNPILLYTGERSEDVKRIGRAFVDEYASELQKRHKLNIWYSLDIRNYLVADAARASFENSVSPTAEAGAPRWHAHAVSSAYGMLGYHAGRRVLEEAGVATPATRPGTLLVQHLGTPDMVLSLRNGGDFSRSRLPGYRLDSESGLYRRNGDDPHYPQVTHDPEEVLDPTFYTHRPVTSPDMNEVIKQYGGDGIVVSLEECLQRYPQLRGWLSRSSRPLPTDLRTVREWSTIMAFTGALAAIEREIVPGDREVVVHASGCYTTEDFVSVDESETVPVQSPSAVARALVQDGLR
ncbi:DUF6002 family protein [Streptomyces fuscichromogenes]|uniref:Uncharacterized protein n=1 Tax=Streptomyces fuscichromogenes TaxID=1324013 RepID=A0A917XNY6_9ACTN|nr:DUF6002 family protein [Streptomyces fuscichromogenes]GGN44845.1 hypothetical protein GCM10011578_096200 [Streptomyces fuscichromogenes]